MSYRLKASDIIAIIMAAVFVAVVALLSTTTTASANGGAGGHVPPDYFLEDFRDTTAIEAQSGGAWNSWQLYPYGRNSARRAEAEVIYAYGETLPELQAISCTKVNEQPFEVDGTGYFAVVIKAGLTLNIWFNPTGPVRADKDTSHYFLCSASFVPPPPPDNPPPPVRIIIVPPQPQPEPEGITGGGGGQSADTIICGDPRALIRLRNTSGEPVTFIVRFVSARTGKAVIKHITVRPHSVRIIKRWVKGQTKVVVRADGLLLASTRVNRANNVGSCPV